VKLGLKSWEMSQIFIKKTILHVKVHERKCGFSQNVFSLKLYSVEIVNGKINYQSVYNYTIKLYLFNKKFGSFDDLLKL